MNFKKIKKVLVILTIVIVSFELLSFILSGPIYNAIFNKRFESVTPYYYEVNEFDGLERNKYQFKSNNNQLLTGYLYHDGSINDSIALIVMAHGLGGGGHIPYMPCINYFANQNFLVFAYDGTGNTESEGEDIIGLPQQLIDLDYAINFIDDLYDLPMMLFGHSWGGYAVCSVLNYQPNIKAVVSLAGFNSSKDIIEAYGRKYVGGLVKTGLPFVTMHEKRLFGDYANASALSGFEKTKTDIMIIHSSDDETVPISVGYDLYYNKYQKNERFKFIKYNDKGHSQVYYSYETINKINEINKEFDSWLETLNYDYTSKKNENRFIKDKETYLNQKHIREVLCNNIDYQLFDQIKEFYINSLK